MSTFSLRGRKASRHKYRVLYAVTREEYYEIHAATAEEAFNRAFSDGTFIETGETMSAIPYRAVTVRSRGGAP